MIDLGSIPPAGTIFDLRNLEGNNCFLCGAILTDINRTVEHVIPKWLQRMMNLWNKRVALLNHTTIPYRELTIPCCKRCNGGPLSILEDEIKQGMTEGFRSFRLVPEERVFQWCAKIYYGLLFRELTLRLDRTDSAKGTIMTPSFLEQLHTFQLFLQSIRVPFIFHDFTPYSVFVFETLTFDDLDRDFDYEDTLLVGPPQEPAMSLHFALRCRDVGIICLFQDNGAQKTVFQPQFDIFEGIPIHPLQFCEMSCKSAYKHSLLLHIPRYIISTTAEGEGPCRVFWHTPNDDRCWGEWDNETYARLFAGALNAWGLPIMHTEIYQGKWHHSYLLDENSQPRRLGRDFDPFESTSG
jgi:hypothetical protein